MNARNAIKIALVALLAGVVAALWFSPLRAYLTADHVREFIGRMRDTWYGPIVLIVAYTIGCIFAVPATLFILASAVIWGWKLGGTYAMIGGLLGATSAFLLGRFVGEGMLAKFGRVGRAVEKQVGNSGFKSILVLRLIPLFPFAVLNYGLGVARVRLSHFVLATAIGLAPSNYVFAYSADTIANSGTMTKWQALERLLIVAVLILTVVLVPGIIKKRMKGVPTAE